MNRVNSFKLLLFTLLFISIQLVAQTDFRQGCIITTTGDSLKGFIDYQADNSLCHKCRFKINKDEKVKDYIPAELKEFQFKNEGRKFISMTVPCNDETKEVFVEILVAGKMNLYYCNDKSLESYFFIQKRGEKHLANLPFKREYKNVKTGYTTYLKTIDSSNHIDTLKKYMQDTPDLFTNIEDIDSPKQKNLIKLVKQYNEFGLNKNKAEIHVKKVKSLAIYLTPAVAYTDFQTSGGNQYNILSGVQIALSLNQSNERLFFNTGILIPVFRKYYAGNVTTNQDSKYLIKVPVLFEYRFPDKPVQPRFSIGYNLYKNDVSLALLSTVSAGVNIRLSKGVSLSIIPGIEFVGSDMLIVVPVAYDSFSLLTGLQIKL